MWELDHKEVWAPKNWCFQIVQKTLERPLDSKKIKRINPIGNQPWILIGRTDAKAEAPILGHLMQKADSLEKILMLGKTEGMRRRGWQRMRWSDGISNSMDMSLIKLQETVKDKETLWTVVHGITKSQTQLSNWTTTSYSKYLGMSAQPMSHPIFPENLPSHITGLGPGSQACASWSLLSEQSWLDLGRPHEPSWVSENLLQVWT